MPGEITDTDLVQAADVSDEVVADVAQGIREMHRQHGMRFVVEVGRLVVERLYGGDAALAHRRGPKASPLARLAEQPELPLSLSQLSRAVAIYEAVAHLGDVATWQHLSMSHVRAVLPLPASDRPDLLRTAEERGWSVKQLEASVRRRRPERRAGGRPTLLPFVRSLRALERLVRDDAAFAGLDAAESLRAEDAERARRTVTELRRRCDEIERLLPAAGP